ncbi:hypothetical protein, partial [Noviherbaspirillum denitrificans]|uniref:hypothetical protein n=1 Tax=Noviherbaspirillum denitrificans TaxID=1968433 RepID=UPI00197D7CFB
MSFISRARTGLERTFGRTPLLFLAVFLVASLATRLMLLGVAAKDVDWLAVPGSLLLGFGYDLITALWALLPIVLLHLLFPQTRLLHPVGRLVKAGALALTIYLLLFNFVAELLF